MQLVTLACDINMTETTLEMGSPVDPAECCNGGQLQQLKEDDSNSDELARENERLAKETSLLKEQLKDANSVIHKLQAELASKQARYSHDVTSLKLQNRKMEEMLRQQRATSDKQLGEVIAHLLFIEGKLMREQAQVKSALKTKDDVIRKQKYDIEDLTLKNERLIQAVREHYARKSVNGMATGQNGQPNQENSVPPSPSPSVKHKKGAFSSVKEKLWKHHRSSFDLTEGQVNMHGNLKEGRQYSSQENLSTLSVRRREARASRDKKCKSIAGYPDHSLERLIPEECEIGVESSPWMKQLNGGEYSPDENSSSNGFNDYDQDHLNVSSGNLMSAGSMPVLSERSESPVKERPHSISSIESLSSPKSPKSPDSKSATPSPAPTPTGDSGPFKGLKTILKRKGSKSKKQKRNVSMSQNKTNEYQEAMKKHFEKYEMA
ncbi:hypothetical protein FSP39_010676 [Pinctada imbricata]|uniref:Uncharacterized protein n=1 Tax=Pinctada imbricata TaxID=66713 RepID=A0AA88XSI2_PINIB|nr:hypothetical protein FSP39_010676 [Pinctada imbricata]